MRVGTVCFAIERGLGYLAKSFYDNGIVTDPIYIAYGKMKDHPEWYPDGIYVTTRPFLNEETKALIRELDVMLFFETPHDWGFIDYARSVGVRTVLMLMYECTKDPMPYVPDRYLCPSKLDQDYFPDYGKSIYLPVPVDEPWQLRERARAFVHNAGQIGLRGRNGTLEILQAMKHVKSPIKLVVRSQSQELWDIVERVPGIREDDRVQLNVGHFLYQSLRKDCDVCLTGEKFNGLSLPLQECRAAGMLVMTANRYPVNTWLPIEPLYPVAGYRKARIAKGYLEFEEAILDPVAIAGWIDKYYDTDITEYSKQGREWAETMTWEEWKPRYLEALDW